MAANVDVAFLVAGLDGDFNLRRLERYLAVAWSSGVTPGRRPQQGRPRRRPRGTGSWPSRPSRPASRSSPCRPGPATTSTTSRRTSVEGQTAVVLGSSGVGKSTLVNALLGEDRQATAAVREDDSRGRHTTTHRELFELPGGALLIDTPGIRSLEVAGADDGRRGRLRRHRDLAATCRFSDCRPRTEPGCAVRAALADGVLTRGPPRQPPEARARSRACDARATRAPGPRNAAAGS